MSRLPLAAVIAVLAFVSRPHPAGCEPVYPQADLIPYSVVSRPLPGYALYEDAARYSTPPSNPCLPAVPGRVDRAP